MATVQPSNNSELQLYRVLQRANLLKYFETFITQGGDDVQQLCEAGEDEFLEIMALVGMASKPLHVRRLQKALQEWVANPAAFEVVKKYPTHVMSMAGSSSPQNVSPSNSMERSSSIQDFRVTPPQSSAISTSTPWRSQTRDTSPSDGSNLDDLSSSDSQHEDCKDTMKDFLYNQTDQFYSSLVGVPQPLLLEHQITAIATAASVLAKDLPPFEPKSMPKKQISQEILTVMQMSADDPHRMIALRKYAAIYGRFDSKRKNDRPMTLHEISVNEAAAQLCSHFPALLTRREELFPLARQVVRDSGYQYSKGHSRYDDHGAAEVLVQPKLEPGEAVPSTSTLILMRHEESLGDLQAELTHITTELTELTKEQDCIRSALRVLLEANDLDQMKKLTAEMDILNDRQTALTKRRERLVNTIARYRKGDSNCSQSAARVSEPTVRGSSSHRLQSSKSANSYVKYSSSGCHGYTDELFPTNPLSTLYMAALQNHRDSLFEEGLRIATQYGMSDFAMELIGMKSTGVEVDNKKDSGIIVSSECGGSSGSMPHSSHSSVSTSSSGAVTPSLTSAVYSVSGSGKFVHSLPSSSSPAVSSGVGYTHTSRSTGDAALNETANAIPVSNHVHDNKHMTMGLPSPEAIHLNTDGSGDASAVDNNYPSKHSSVIGKQNVPTTTVGAQGSATTTTTKSNNVVEVETRRSSRKKNGDPDYYLINGGEKRFRSENGRRSSSNPPEHPGRLSSLSSARPLTSSTPLSASTENQKSDSQTNGDSVVNMNLSVLNGKNKSDVQTVTLDMIQSDVDLDGADTNRVARMNEDNENADSEKWFMRKKVRVLSTA